MLASPVTNAGDSTLAHLDVLGPVAITIHYMVK